jgi:hypothetical protein
VQRLCESRVVALGRAGVFVVAVTLVRVLLNGLEPSREVDGKP